MARTISHSFASLTREISVADPDFELRWGPGFGLLALLAFLPSVISSFFTQNTGGGGGGRLGPSPRSPTAYCSCHSNIKFISSRHRVISSIYRVVRKEVRQLRSQGLSSYHPLERTRKDLSLFAPGSGKMRDPGNKVGGQVVCFG